ncbi:hypothetical protein ANCCAN_16251 [Ancylostoma caninum]|uniref:Uncharacterized protein n=1 Tax=Ancylostoma caninum TaxID=29170 RepID=A0A368G071_ANCCA|nr:hypothetical protein ANCCAN_16251 [Ancylostoma caninum]
MVVSDLFGFSFLCCQRLYLYSTWDMATCSSLSIVSVDGQKELCITKQGGGE